MPLYTYKCCECDAVVDVYRHIAELNNAPMCHGQMRKIIVPPMIQPILGGGNNPGYQCPVTGEFVSSRKRRKQIMREHNLAEKD